MSDKPSIADKCACDPASGAAKSGGGTGSFKRPIMRGLHMQQIKRNVTIAIVLGAVAVTSLKFLRNEPRKRDYAEFYK